ncbi:hypothetical protein [Corynebacterium sp. TAE3-ERU16]|uniref:hypothetical protein n=1 Tax=Corynebacterium sp. TAE3-ERU16 TaxID=2849493 RepID=UPI001C46BB14|nr:hypothetical protein [Corynebacterium sp. TAE3-ERU16]MBV7292360.1 hypothetical protein [Corynebacterium sp. TAE3-ERU16]
MTYVKHPPTSEYRRAHARARRGHIIVAVPVLLATFITTSATAAAYVSSGHDRGDALTTFTVIAAVTGTFAAGLAIAAVDTHERDFEEVASIREDYNERLERKQSERLRSLGLDPNLINYTSDQ